MFVGLRRRRAGSIFVAVLAVALVSGLLVPAAEHLPAAAAAPTVPPDGKIVYEVRRGPETGYVSEIWLAESDGSAPRQLTSGYYDHDPQWNPQGTTIAFTREYPVDGSVPLPEGVRSRVLAISETGGSPTPLALPPTGDVIFDLYEQLISWTPDGGGIVFDRRWRDDPFGPIVIHGGTYATGGAVPVARPIAVPEPVVSNLCAGPTPEVRRVSAVPHPDPGDPRVLVQSRSTCTSGFYLEAGTGLYGSSGPVTRIPVTYGSSAPSANANEFTATDWSPDGTEIYDGGFWAAPASGGAARHLVPAGRYTTGVLANGCQLAVAKAVTWSDGDGSWAPANDMIAASLAGESFTDLGEGPPGLWCTATEIELARLGIWRIDPTGSSPARLLIPREPGTDLVEPDVQCRVGSCLTILRVVAQGPTGSTYTFSGALSGVTSPVDPFGQGGVLSKKVTAGEKSVTATVPPGQRLENVTCDAPHTANLAGRSVSVTVGAGAVVTCTFIFTGTSDDDRDGDGILNSVDACPDASGPASTGGCPDRDGDTVPDTTDACPDVAGLVANNGCPIVAADLDRDGWSDSVEHLYGSLDSDAASRPIDPLDQIEDPTATVTPEQQAELDCDHAVDGLTACALQPGDLLLWKAGGAEANGESFLGATHFTHALIIVGRFKLMATGNVTLNVADVTPGRNTEFMIRPIEATDAVNPQCGTTTGECLEGLGVYRPNRSRVDREAAARKIVDLATSHGMTLATGGRAAGIAYGGPSVVPDPTAWGPDRFYCSSLVGWAYGVGLADFLASRHPLLRTPYFVPDDLLEVIGSTLVTGYGTDAGVFTIFSPAHVLLADPDGHRTGLGPDGQQYNELTGGLWREEDVNEGVSAPGVTDEWTGTLTGFDTGEYALQTTIIHGATVTRHVIAGYTRPGLVETFRFGDVADLVGRPAAHDDTFATDESTTGTFDVLGNDIDPDANLDQAALSISSPPSHGTAQIVDGAVRYQAPAVSDPTTDQFTYRVCDADGHCSEAIVTVTINPVIPANQAPVATSLMVATDQGQAVATTLAATDADGDALQYSVTVPPAHGVLTGTAPNLTYTPAAGYTGTDTFSWVARDAASSSDVATVRVEVRPACAPLTSLRSISGRGRVGSARFEIALSRVRRPHRRSVWVGAVSITDSSPRVSFVGVVFSTTPPLRIDPSTCRTVIGRIDGVNSGGRRKVKTSLSLRLTDSAAGDTVSLGLGSRTWSGQLRGSLTIR